MQQTTTYKLNKPESTDTFSVSPLNENADKLETQLARLDGADAAEADARQEADAALDARVTLLEAKKIVVGTYVGEDAVSSAKPHVVSLDFTPFAVIVQGGNAIVTIMAIQGAAGSSLWILDGGFAVMRGQTSDLDAKNAIYRFLAFG